MRSLILAFAVLTVLFSLPAEAQQVRLVGTVEALDGRTVTVATKDMGRQAVVLDANANVSKNVKKTLADIKPGDNVGVTSVKDKDGKHIAVEVRIFPSDRVPNLAQFPLEYAPDNIMTNAAVAEVVKAADGSVLKVKFPNGESDIVVGPTVPVLTSQPGSLDLLKPGASVAVFATKGPDGKLTSRRVSVD